MTATQLSAATTQNKLLEETKLYKASETLERLMTATHTRDECTGRKTTARTENEIRRERVIKAQHKHAKTKRLEDVQHVQWI